MCCAMCCAVCCQPDRLEQALLSKLDRIAIREKTSLAEIFNRIDHDGVRVEHWCNCMHVSSCPYIQDGSIDLYYLTDAIDKMLPGMKVVNGAMFHRADVSLNAPCSTMGDDHKLPSCVHTITEPLYPSLLGTTELLSLP